MKWGGKKSASASAALRPLVVLWTTLVVLPLAGQELKVLPIEQWKSGLSSAEHCKRRTALQQIAEAGEDAKALLPEVRTSCGDTDDLNRLLAKFAVARLSGDASGILPDLIAHLESPEGWARSRGCWMLRDLGPKASAATPALLSLLMDPNRVDTENAFEALDAIAPETEEVRATLSALFAAEERDIRFGARRSWLRKGGDPEVVFARYREEIRPRKGVRIDSINQPLGDLIQFGPLAAPITAEVALWLGDRVFDDKARRILAAIGPPAAPVLARTAIGGGQGARSALRTLATIGEGAEEAAPQLAEALFGGQGYFTSRERRDLARALSHLGPRGAESLRRGVKDADPEVVRWTLAALRKWPVLSERNSVAALLGDPWVGRQAASVLAACGHGALPMLLPRLRSSSAAIRQDAARALAGMGPPAAAVLADLSPLLEDPKSAFSAHYAAALITGEAAPHQEALLAGLAEGGSEREMAMYAFAHLKGGSAEVAKAILALAPQLDRKEAAKAAEAIAAQGVDGLVPLREVFLRGAFEERLLACEAVEVLGATASPLLPELTNLASHEGGTSSPSGRLVVPVDRLTEDYREDSLAVREGKQLVQAVEGALRAIRNASEGREWRREARVPFRQDNEDYGWPVE